MASLGVGLGNQATLAMRNSRTLRQMDCGRLHRFQARLIETTERSRCLALRLVSLIVLRAW